MIKVLINTLLLGFMLIGFSACGGGDSSSTINNTEVVSTNIDSIKPYSPLPITVELVSSFDENNYELELYQLNSTKGQATFFLDYYGRLGGIYAINSLLPLSSAASSPYSQFGGITPFYIDNLSLYTPNNKRKVDISVTADNNTYNVSPEVLLPSTSYVLELRKKDYNTSIQLLSFNTPSLGRKKYNIGFRQVSEYIYDDNQMIKSITYSGNGMDMSMLSENSTREEALVEIERWISESAEVQSVYFYAYNAENNLSISSCSELNCTDEEKAFVSEIVFNANHNISLLRDKDNNIFNPVTDHYQYIYNDKNLLVEIIDLINDENLSFVYDENNNITSINERCFEYDMKGNYTLMYSCENPEDVNYIASFEYNGSLPTRQDNLPNSGYQSRYNIEYNEYGKPLNIFNPYFSITEEKFVNDSRLTMSYRYYENGDLSHILLNNENDEFYIRAIYE